MLKRITIAVACALAAGGATVIASTRAPANDAADFTFQWRGGQAVMRGESPYAALDSVAPYPYGGGYLYPLPTAVVIAPFALLRMHTAWILYGAVMTGLLAFALTRDGYWRLPMLMSLPMLTAVQLGQYSPLVVAMGLIAGLEWLAFAKPTLGLAMFAWRPRRSAIVGVVVAGVIAGLFYPRWFIDYLHEIQRESHNYQIPLLTLPFGPLLLLALARWRDPDARLVLVMSCIPQTMLFADQLPLFLLARTYRHMLVMALLSYLPLAVAPFVQGPADQGTAALMSVMSRILVPLYFLPCLAIVLSRGRSQSVTEPLAAPEQR